MTRFAEDFLARMGLRIPRPLEKKEHNVNDRMGFDVEIKLATEETKAGSFEGYASVFNLLDRGGDIVMPGAFKASLGEWRKRKALPPMLWYHDPAQPIGVWTELVEDDKGLKAVGELILDLPQATNVYALMKRGALKGLSIGYRTKSDEIDRTNGARRIKALELFEISLVTIPQLPEATVTAVKSEDQSVDDRALEQAYRDGGLSQREAKIAVSVTKKMVPREVERKGPTPREVVTDALMSIRKTTQAMRSE